jgi:hypothetical protein
MRSQYTKYVSLLLQTLCGTLVGGSSLVHWWSRMSWFRFDL